MRIFNKFRGTQGWLSLWERTLRFRHMRNQQEVERRVKILSFWRVHREEAARDAFRVSRRTLYRWSAALTHAQGKLEAIDPRSTAPSKRRHRTYPPGFIEAIIALRHEHPRLGKEKCAPLLRNQGFNVSVSFVGRTLADLKKRRLLPSNTRLSFYARSGTFVEKTPHIRKKLRRPKGYRVLEVDTVVRFIDGVKRYILTGIDTERRIAFAAAYTNHGSASAADFLSKCRVALPDCPASLQTDNGSEFALHFAQTAGDLHLTHFHTYPRSPKMNAHVERFNRTLSEEFLRFNRALLRDDVRAFNEKLIEWLLWYNGERPHHALGQVAPFRFMMASLPREECQMWWTDTSF